MENDVAAGISSLWAGHFEAQERRLSVVEQAVVGLVAGSLDDAGRQSAKQAAHKLAGSLGTFGLEDGSRIAGQIEEALLADKDDSGSIHALASAVGALRSVLEKHRPTADAPLPTETSQPAENAMDILLVDDDDVFARYVLEPLQRRYRISWVSSGESALAALAKCGDQYPKLILLDIEMPGMKGLTVLEQLAERGVVEQSAVVMLTRRSVVEDIVRARNLGAFDFLAKPISVSMLNERVSRALETAR